VAGSPRVSEEFRAFLLEATALAALGTVADVVPLVGENRTLVHFGLGGLRKSKLKGMAALIASTGLTGQHLDSYHAGFLLAPRLNACGRMGHARLAVHLLTEAGDEEALEIAAFLESQNRQRQALEKQILVQALEQIDKLGLGGEQHHAIVLGAEGWHPGVIGIVASRIVERFHRPAILVALNEGKGQGSGRSVPGFHLGHALTTCREYLEKCGGHEMAAGLRLDAGRFEAFREAFGELARRTLDKRLLAPELKLECRAELRQITLALASELKRLGPFGNGNRRPLICCDKVEVAAPPRRVGRTGEHLQFRVRQRDVSIKCIAFNAAGGEELVRPGSLLDLAAEPTVNEFHGRHSVELEIRDLRPAGGE